MLFDVSELEKLAKVRPTRILHVGAHKGEERDSYLRVWGAFLEQILWIEGQPALVENLNKVIDKGKEKVIQAFVWSDDKIEMDFFVANNSEASSLLEFEAHADLYPEIMVNKTDKVLTTTLHTLIGNDKPYDFVNIDIQGAELAALQGLQSNINFVRWIYTEINVRQMYREAPLLQELKNYLSAKGFKLQGKRLNPGGGWGDAIFVRKEEFSYLAWIRLYFSTSKFHTTQLWYRIRGFIRLRSRLRF